MTNRFDREIIQGLMGTRVGDDKNIRQGKGYTLAVGQDPSTRERSLLLGFIDAEEREIVLDLNTEEVLHLLQEIINLMPLMIERDI